MKNRIVLLLFVFLGASFQNCSNDFELTENWKDITIIYGLLDASDSVQYIRVEKAFLDESTSALVGAQVADSLYYEDVTVQLQELPGGGGSGLFHILEKVDANTEGFQKVDGIFATSPNYIYKLDKPLVTSAAYRLIVSKGDNSDDIIAQTDVIGTFNITFPTNNFKLRFASGNGQFFRWNEDPDAGFYDLVLRIHITEAPAGNPSDVTYKSLDWKIASNIKPDNSTNNLIIHEVEDGADFYKFLQGSLTPDATIVRDLLSVDILVYAGGHELLNYMEAGRATAGITSAESLPTYTNISEGLGLFSTRYSQEETGLGVLSFVRDTLREGPYTKDLGFQ